MNKEPGLRWRYPQAAVAGADDTYDVERLREILKPIIAVRQARCEVLDPGEVAIEAVRGSRPAQAVA
jgi:hypothetical protein